MSFEQTQLQAANRCYASGDIQGAIAHLTSLAAILGCELPPPPLLYKSIHEMVERLTPYYFKILNLVSRDIRKTVIKVRAASGSPFQIVTKKEARSKAKTPELTKNS